MQPSTRKTLFVGVGILFVALAGWWWYSGFSLEFMKFFAAEPLGTPVTDSSSVVFCSPSTQTVKIGTPATLKTGKGFEGAKWYAPEGTPSTGQGFNFSVQYATAGTKKVTIEAARADNPAYIDSVACTVEVTP